MQMQHNVVFSCYAAALLCADGEDWSHKWEGDNETEASWVSVVHGGWLCHWVMVVQQQLLPITIQPLRLCHMPPPSAGRKTTGGKLNAARTHSVAGWLLSARGLVGRGV
jgi:hypothetical protein